MAVALLAFSRAGAQGSPGPDIFLASLTVRGTQIDVGTPRNITRRPGYDNQPSFTPNGLSILYTAIGDEAQADIYRYDIRADSSVRLTVTAESEYSPTVMPDGSSFSVIRVERDSAQRLWAFRLDGTNPQLVLPNIKPVGYQAWADDHTLVLFVLGRPATLHRVDTRSGSDQIVADNIGRSIHRIPKRHAVSFVQKMTPDDWWISELDLNTGRVTRVVRTLARSEDYAWTPDGVLLMARDATLYAFHPKRPMDWMPLKTFGEPGLARITRLAVSPSGDHVAMVGEIAKVP